MAKKKKKLEEDAWLWLSQPYVPGSSMPVRYVTIAGWQRTEQNLTPKGEMPIEGFTRAMFEYGALAALDPTNVPEGAVWATAFGVSYRWGLLFAVAKGILIGAPLLAIVDPQDRWEGGLDETAIYQSIESDIKYGVGLGWAASPANPSNW